MAKVMRKPTLNKKKMAFKELEKWLVELKKPGMGSVLFLEKLESLRQEWKEEIVQEFLAGK